MLKIQMAQSEPMASALFSLNEFYTPKNLGTIINYSKKKIQEIYNAPPNK